ncbi:MAG: hypothetical protein KatS3mg110_3229 [Pirellulaceae bacterium]|nr:MAG: hypothetical protein KatS3mg110_3229 [Pirellulaceae bacterium]
MSQDYNAEIEQLYETIASGFTFLFTNAAKTGHWSEPRSTALAAICLTMLEDASSVWLRAVRDWIEAQQIRSGHAQGSWCEEIWDTGMCVYALKELGVNSRHPTVESALDWIGSLYSLNGRGNWHDELWETCWALIAILRCGRTPPSVDIVQPIRWLISLQQPDGNVVAPHYTGYFLLIHTLSRNVMLEREFRNTLDAAKDKCTEYLLKMLKDCEQGRLWTGEPWSNGQILWALCVADSLPTDNEVLIRKIVSWFRDAQGPQGNWLDVEDTASAILGLVSLVRLLATSGGLTKEGAESLVERRLRRMISVPALKTRKPFLERDTETGYVCINVPVGAMNLVVGVLGFILVALVAWVANVVQILEWLKHR